MADLPKFIELEVVNEVTKTSRVEKVHIQYDMLPKYCKHCRLQGHDENDCRVLHPELRKSELESENNKDIASDIQEGQPKVLLIRIGRYFKKWLPMNKTTTKQRHDDKKKKGEEVVSTCNSFAALNDKGTCKKGLQYSEVNTSNTISLKTDNGEDDEVTTKEKATQMEEKDQQHRSTKHWVSKTFAQNNHITENHQKNITDKGKDIQKHTGEGNTIQQMESTKLNATNTGLELVLRNENRHLVAVEQDERRLKKKERDLMLAQQSGPALSSNRYVNTESTEDILDELAIFQEPLQIVGSEQILAIESNSTRDVKVIDGVGEATRKRDLDVAPAISHTCKNSSPISTLHNLVSHQITEGDCQAISKNYRAEDIEDSEEENNTSNEDQIMKTGGIKAKSSSKGIKDTGDIILATVIYAKCDALERINMWDDIYNISVNYNMPWLVGGDFNVIMSDEEKTGGLPVYPQAYEDFSFGMNSCELLDINFKGSPFTWWNGKIDGECIFKRLDRIMVNQSFIDFSGNIEMEHLARTGSDHAPILLTCGGQSSYVRKPFRFLKFWVEKEGFLETVTDSWKSMDSTDVFISLKQKMKNTKTALSRWSRKNFDDIFKQLIIREDIVRLKEALFEENSTASNRMILQQSQAKLHKYIHYEEDYWRQKAGFQWYIEGDKNTRFFLCLVNGRRKKLSVIRMLQEDGEWAEGNDQVAEEAIKFFKSQFVVEDSAEELTLLRHVPQLISEGNNELIKVCPTKEEVKKVVFKLNGNSASGPDGFTSLFFQTCWEIVGDDVFNVVAAFFNDFTLPKSITHTNLVLIPNKDFVQSFTDMRPISLSNFLNKVISRIVHDRLESVLPSTISKNQSGFLKGRNISENFLLAQEIVSDIRIRGKPANVVIKLDMTKAYDS
ncbi:hypothetical protein KY290_027708 [Solanum tuberosum]|uniref:Reverse transcriptase domain-containing protein n=1 Tax=Solanum tuberosum TaxID=4113 RepID=A0ABQ7UHM8_SOLTU|nr:hypothetical protein KY290_027708 [Solanum tuberosum]